MRLIIGRQTVAAGALAVVLAACGGVAAPTTTVADPDVTTTPTEPVVTESSTSTSSSTSTTLAPGGPALAVEGDNNETVEAFQFLLNCNGYGDLTVDGAFGPATLTAVEAAQAGLGRAVTGAPDAETMADLSRSCSDNRRLPGDGDGVITVFGNAAPGDPEVFSVALLAGSTLSVTVTLGLGHLVTVRAADGSEIAPSSETIWEIATTQDHLIEVNSPSGPVMFALAVNVTPGVQETGDWILATDSISYRGTKLSLGDDAQTVIDEVIGFLGHGIRGSYLEFDTDWYTITDPQDLGLRGVFIEGFALLFFGPDPVHPAEPETFERWRFEGPSDDGAGVARPDDYATTSEGITVGDALLDLMAAYGSDVDAGSNSEEHYYRFSDSGGEICFYFGAAAPSNSSTIVEIASECRG